MRDIIRRLKAAGEITRSTDWQIYRSAELGKAIDEIKKEVGVELPDDDFDTFSGLVFSELGSIPDDGSSFETDAYGLHIKVESVQDHQIESALICVIPKESDGDEDED